MKNNKLNIIYLDFDDIKNPLLGAGQAKATLEVGSRLAKKGHHVTVICSRYPEYQDRTENGIEYKHIGLGSKNIRLNNVFYFLSIPLAVLNIKRGDIIIECFTAPISTLFGPIFTKIPVVALPSMFNAGEFTKKYKLPFHWVEKFGLKFYKYILPYSEIDSSKAKRLNPDIIYKIIPQGVGKEYFAIKQREPKYILFLGRFDIAQKGIDLLLQAYAKVADRINYPLVIAGHGPDNNKIINLISKLGLENKVKIAGPAYGKNKFTLMSQALFVAFPSRHDEMCLWALEALAGGLPLIGFDIPESKWLNSKISLKAEPFNIDKYSEILLKATDPKIVTPMRKNARIISKKYTWEKVVNDFEDFFRDILEKEAK
jgi:glycosyltransferase involved in cell wall biosynthesis